MNHQLLRLLRPNWPAPPRVRAVSTTRRGGVSAGAYASLNLGGHVGDDPNHVQENRRRLRATLGLPADPVWMRQVHGANVVDAATVVPDSEADGAYSNRTDIACAVLSADCLPIFICNRQGTEVGLLHAGWRGLASGIVEAGLRAFRSPVAELMVWFGPAIGARAYEVGSDVRDAFVAPDAQAAAAFRAAAAGKWYMDIYQVTRLQLAAHGVRAMYGGEHCTATQVELFFSHRRDGLTGRMASLIWLE